MGRIWFSGGSVVLASIVIGCAASPGPPPPGPSVAPATQPAVSLDLNGSPIAPMYRELLAIDLPTVIRVANARNLDIERARQQVEAQRGRYESNVEAIFPVIAPSIAYDHFQGVGQNANGTLTTPVHFDNLLPAISIQWILNPGMVVYDIIASKRRLEASVQQEQSVTLDTVRVAAVQYYDLTLAQARLQVAEQAVSEAQELLRITQLQVRAGTGLPADEVRAQAQLAGFQQDVVVALNDFYQASVALTLTLHLDPVVTLVPALRKIDQVMLVREDLPIDELLATAVKYRPDLQAISTLILAAQADTGATVWGGFGPQLQAGYTANGIKASISGHHYDWKEQQKAGVGASFALSLSTFGNLKTAQANERSAGIDAERQFDLVRAAVVSAQQNSVTNAKLIPVAKQQLDAAQEALRLTQANLQAGTALVIDVLQAQNTVDDAQLRYVTAVVHYDQSQVNLLAALGLIDRTTVLAVASSQPAPATP
ncbi:MAG TPA: TolC family protein [Tepidisphaeraceae bacterium]|jgi:outer membrane protein TolC|nr:TolC family protein [Tepidisphaeraceae bacterium]